MIAGAVIIGRRLWEGLRGAMKGSGGQGIMDIDTKKIEAIKPENINTLFKDVAGMHEAKF
jgi:ATP-dependent Zn protease